MIPALKADLEAIARFQRVVAELRACREELAADNEADADRRSSLHPDLQEDDE